MLPNNQDPLNRTAITQLSEMQVDFSPIGPVTTGRECLHTIMHGYLRRSRRQDVTMKDSGKRFAKAILDSIHKNRILGIRAGTGSTHRVIGIWVVVVRGRVFVRSYQLKPGGWWQTLLKDPHGEIVPWGRKRGIKIRAVPVKSTNIKEAVSAAYREKYNTPGSVGYVEEMSRPPSRDATVELVPA